MKPHAQLMLVQAFDALVVAALIVRLVWPWDWRGRRREVVLRRDRRPWE